MSVERRKALRKPIAPLSQRVYSVLFHVESTQVIREVVVDADVDLIVITVPRWNLLVQPTIQRASEGELNPPITGRPAQLAPQRANIFSMISEVEAEHVIIVIRTTVISKRPHLAVGSDLIRITTTVTLLDVLMLPTSTPITTAPRQRRRLLAVRVHGPVTRIIMWNLKVLDGLNEALLLVIAHVIDDGKVVELELLNDTHDLFIGPAVEIFRLQHRIMHLRAPAGEDGEHEAEDQAQGVPRLDVTRHGALRVVLLVTLLFCAAWLRQKQSIPSLTNSCRQKTVCEGGHRLLSVERRSCFIYISMHDRCYVVIYL